MTPRFSTHPFNINEKYAPNRIIKVIQTGSYILRNVHFLTLIYIRKYKVLISSINWKILVPWLRFPTRNLNNRHF